MTQWAQRAVAGDEAIRAIAPGARVFVHEIPLVTQAAQRRVRDGADAHLQRRAVFDQRGDVPADDLLDPTPLLDALVRRGDLHSITLYHLHTAGPAPFVDLEHRERFRSVSLFAGAPVRRGPVVNQPFPAVVAAARWLPLIRALPPLPSELDFALWGRDLVLVDVAANLVLDVLPDALPTAANPGVVYP